MNIKQFRFGSDNLGYLVFGEQSAAAIDGGAAHDILHFLAVQRLKLLYVTNTHDHSDHTPGNRTLLDKSGALFLDNRRLRKEGFFSLEETEIKVLSTPGHSYDSVTFHYDNILITGDTLFNGTIGNCYTGDYETFFRSVKLLTGLPEETLIYAGHDLVEHTMAVTKSLEPDNTHAGHFLKKYSPDNVCSTLGEELLHNVFIRFNDHRLDSLRKKTCMPLNTEYDRWRALMTIH